MNRVVGDFTDQSDRLQRPGSGHFTERPFATRSLGHGTDRVTLLADRIRFRRAGVWTEQPVEAGSWDDVAKQWFGLNLE